MTPTSRPAWGAWIETHRRLFACIGSRRAPHGARGLKRVQELELCGSKTVAPRMGRVD